MREEAKTDNIDAPPLEYGDRLVSSKRGPPVVRRMLHGRRVGLNHRANAVRALPPALAGPRFPLKSGGIAARSPR